MVDVKREWWDVLSNKHETSWNNTPRDWIFRRVIFPNEKWILIAIICSLLASVPCYTIVIFTRILRWVKWFSDLVILFQVCTLKKKSIFSSISLSIFCSFVKNVINLYLHPSCWKRTTIELFLISPLKSCKDELKKCKLIERTMCVYVMNRKYILHENVLKVSRNRKIFEV